MLTERLKIQKAKTSDAKTSDSLNSVQTEAARTTPAIQLLLTPALGIKRILVQLLTRSLKTEVGKLKMEVDTHARKLVKPKKLPCLHREVLY